MLGAPLSHISLSHSTLSLSLSQVRGARTFELLARHPWYHAIVRRRRTPYVHRISMVALPELCVRTYANRAKVRFKSSHGGTVRPDQPPGWHRCLWGCRCRACSHSAQSTGSRANHPSVGSERCRRAVPALSSRRILLTGLFFFALALSLSLSGNSSRSLSYPVSSIL